MFTANIIAQTPQAFKYQTVVRDASGNVLADQTIGLEISILEDSNTGTPVYTETWTKTSNQFGLITLNIGEGTVQNGSFSSVDWGNHNYWIKIAVDESGGSDYSDIGTSQLLSVPYAIYANQSADGNCQWVNNGTTIYYNGGNVGVGTTTPSGKLVIQADDGAAADSALFEVKDKFGQPIMRVTSEGVRIYVKDAVQGTSGGFAVGRYTGAKNFPDTSYLIVTPDSTRVYTSGNSKGVSGGFAVGRYTGAKDNLTENCFFTGIDNTKIWTRDSVTGFSVQNKNDTSATSYMHLTPQNYFIGHNSGENNTLGLYNNFFGYNAGKSNTQGYYNTFIGYESGYSNIGYKPSGSVLLHGYKNTFIGYQTGRSNTMGDNNTFLGSQSGYNNTEGRNNVFLGVNSGQENTIGIFNTFTGNSSGKSNINGNYNTFLGTNAGYNNTSGESNTYIGIDAGVNIHTGNNNVSIGSFSMGGGLYESSGTGNNNVYIGSETAYYNKNGSGNVFLGYQAGKNETGSNKLYISNSLTSAPLIYGDFSTNKVTINDVLILTPATQPENPVEGELYVDSSTHHIYCYLNGTWTQLD